MTADFKWHRTKPRLYLDEMRPVRAYDVTWMRILTVWNRNYMCYLLVAFSYCWHRYINSFAIRRLGVWIDVVLTSFMENFVVYASTRRSKSLVVHHCLIQWIKTMIGNMDSQPRSKHSTGDDAPITDCDSLFTHRQTNTDEVFCLADVDSHHKSPLDTMTSALNPSVIDNARQ